MSLKEHKVQNVVIEEGIKTKIQALRDKITKALNPNKKLNYYIQSTDGKLWGDLYLKDLTSLYSINRDEYMLYYKETKEGEVVYHNLIDNTYCTPQEFIPLVAGTFSCVDINNIVSKEDILYANVLPTIDGKVLKEKVEANRRIACAQIIKALKR